MYMLVCASSELLQAHTIKIKIQKISLIESSGQTYNRFKRPEAIIIHRLYVCSYGLY